MRSNVEPSGTRGMGSVSSLVLGSVPTTLIQLSPVPVY